MATTTVRVSKESREVLRDLADQLGEPMQEVLARAIEVYRRQHILEQTNAAYAAIRRRPRVWEEVRKERREWDATLADDLRER